MAASRGRPSSLVPEDTSGVIRVRVLEGRNLKACDLNVRSHRSPVLAWLPSLSSRPDALNR
jgi:hypothetical protein